MRSADPGDSRNHGTGSQARENLIIMDANGEYIHSFGKTKVLAYSTLPLSRLMQELKSNKDGFNIATRKTVILAVGMDDWATGKPVREILEGVVDVVIEIRRQSKSCHIALASLIHRPCEFDSSFREIKSLNIQLHGMARQMGISFFKHSTPFCTKTGQSWNFTREIPTTCRLLELSAC